MSKLGKTAAAAILAAIAMLMIAAPAFAAVSASVCVTARATVNGTSVPVQACPEPIVVP